MAVHGSGPDEEYLAMAMEYIKGFLEKIGTRCQAGIIGPADETISRSMNLPEGGVCQASQGGSADSIEK